MPIFLQIGFEFLGFAMADLDWADSGVVCFLQFDGSVTNILAYIVYNIIS